MYRDLGASLGVLDSGGLEHDEQAPVNVQHVARPHAVDRRLVPGRRLQRLKRLQGRQGRGGGSDGGGGGGSALAEDQRPRQRRPSEQRPRPHCKEDETGATGQGRVGRRLEEELKERLRRARTFYAFSYASYTSPMPFLCLSYASPMPFLCFFYAFSMRSLCFSYAFPMIVRCRSYAAVDQLGRSAPMPLPNPALCFARHLSYASPKRFLSVSYAFPMLSLSFSYAFHGSSPRLPSSVKIAGGSESGDPHLHILFGAKTQKNVHRPGCSSFPASVAARTRN